MLSDLRETGQLEQDADLVILINRPDVLRPRQPTRRRSGPDPGKA